MTPAPDGKCIRCNGSGGELTTIEVPAANQFPAEGVEPRREEARVHPEHEDRAREFAERAHRQSGVFIVVMAVVPVPWRSAWGSSAPACCRPKGRASHGRFPTLPRPVACPNPFPRTFVVAACNSYRILREGCTYMCKYK